MESLLDHLGIRGRQRFSGVTRIAPPDRLAIAAMKDLAPNMDVNFGWEHYRNCAESHFSVLRSAINGGTFPFLLLEDDVETQGFPESPIECPDDADALYLGTSHGNPDYVANAVSDELLRIERVYSAHAIVYLTKAYAEAVITDGTRAIYESDMPFDVAVAFETQSRFNVYGMRTPIFYQSDAKNQVNKWEHMTRTPLSPRGPLES